MWLVILLFSALISTALWYSRADKDELMLSRLSLILWGASIMVFIDHLIGFITNGGEFLEISTGATVLGFMMLATALILWEANLLLKDPKAVWRRQRIKNKQQSPRKSTLPNDQPNRSTTLFISKTPIFGQQSRSRQGLA